MRKHTHRVAARAACAHLGLGPERTDIVLKHTMDPDHDLRGMNRFMKGLWKKNPELFEDSRRYRTKDAFTLHTHNSATYYTVYFAGLSRQASSLGMTEESDRLLAYGLHYLVDCATPVHARTFASARDFFTRRHRRYEDHLDDSVLAGTLDLSGPLRTGLKAGILAGTGYARDHALALAGFSSAFYKPLLASVRRRSMHEAEEITRGVFRRLGADMALFLSTYA